MIRIRRHKCTGVKRRWCGTLKPRKRLRLAYTLKDSHWQYLRAVDDIDLGLSTEILEPEMDISNDQIQEPTHIMAHEWPIYRVLDLQQRDHVIALRQMGKHHLVLFDSSETGCGKTYAAPGLAEQFKYTPELFMSEPRPTSKTLMFVITIKPVIEEFQRLCSRPDFQQSIELIGIANFDLLVKGKCWVFEGPGQKPKKVKNPYLEIHVSPQKENICDQELLQEWQNLIADEITDIDMNSHMAREYVWNLPNRTLLVIDEAHKARNMDSQASKIVCAAIEQYRLDPHQRSKIRILQSSATLFEKYETHLPMIMYFAGLIRSPNLQEALGVLRDPELRRAIMQQDTQTDQHRMFSLRELDVLTLHQLLFQGQFPCAHSMKLKMANTCRLDGHQPAFHNEIRSVYCRIRPEDMDTIQRTINEVWNLMVQEQEKHLSSAQMVLMGKYLKLKELYKTENFLKFVQLAVEAQLSCLVLLNYKETLSKMYDFLVQNCPKFNTVRIMGGQCPKDRQEAIRAFQSNRSRVILAMAQAAGTGISLHDITSTYPVVTIISPPWSATNLTQESGRGFRNGSKSDCLQLLVFFKNTIEEKVYAVQKSKLRCQDILNYGHVNERTHVIFNSHQPLDSNIDKFSSHYRHRFAHFIEQIKIHLT